MICSGIFYIFCEFLLLLGFYFLKNLFFNFLIFLLFLCFCFYFCFSFSLCRGAKEQNLKNCRKAYKYCFPPHPVQGYFYFQDDKRFISGRSRTEGCWLGKMTLWHLQAAFSNAADETCLTERKSVLQYQLLPACFPLQFLKLICYCALFYFTSLVKDFLRYLEIARNTMF